MKKYIGIFITFILAVLIVLTACQPVSIYTQRATATAYATDYMVSAMQAAEDGAMALCNINFDEGPEAYLQAICDASTDLGCTYFGSQIAEGWGDLERSYNSDLLECVVGTSRFLEEGQQFGMNVQYWQVNLQGTTGWSNSNRSREYWLQVAEESSNWKLNRVLTSEEIAFYKTIDSMGEEQ